MFIAYSALCGMAFFSRHILHTVARNIMFTIIIMQSEVRMRSALLAVEVLGVHQGYYATVVSIVHFRV
jgi:hypothetical protein